MTDSPMCDSPTSHEGTDGCDEVMDTATAEDVMSLLVARTAALVLERLRRDILAEVNAGVDQLIKQNAAMRTEVLQRIKDTLTEVAP